MSDIFGFDDDEELEGMYVDDPYYEEFVYTGEDRYTLYGDYQHAGESWTMTGQEWIGEAYQDQWRTLELYGLSPMDIIEDLMDAGYDYVTISDITGEEISGIWDDWRELYGETA